MKFIVIANALVTFFLLLNMSQLNFPLDKQSEAIINQVVERFLNERMIDIFWNRIHYVSTQFESIDNYSTSGTATVLPVTITTGAVSGNEAELRADLTQLATDPLLRFDKEQRFRTEIQLDSTTSVTSYVVLGDVTDTFWGFKIANAVVSGVAQVSGGSEQLVTLFTYAANDRLELEAIINPKKGQQIVFKVNGVERGILRTGFPITIPNPALFDYRVKTNAVGAKAMIIRYFNYIQAR